MGPRTCGLDWWRISELKELPDEAWDQIAEMFNMVEAADKPVWPTPLTIASVPLLVKFMGALAPTDMRPLSICSVLYRLWAGIRYQHLADWQDCWADPAIVGGRKGHEAIEATWDTSADIEQALLQKLPLIGALLDYSKFFDLMVPAILWPLAIAMGCPPEIVKMVRVFNQQLKRTFKFSRHFGPYFRSTNSIPQGCPLSMLWANLLMNVWIRLVRHHCERQALWCRISAYVDDRNIRVRTQIALANVCLLYTSPSPRD